MFKFALSKTLKYFNTGINMIKKIINVRIAKFKLSRSPPCKIHFGNKK